MSKHSDKKTSRLTVPLLAMRKQKGGEKIVMLTAYTAPVTRLLDPYVDMLLVGDSLGMVIYGMENTLSVTLDMMINHGKAVVNASERACVVVDMPFSSFEESKEQAYRNASRILSETGASAVKLEGGVHMQETIAFLSDRGIPVMAHIGLLPQHLQRLGGFKIQGMDKRIADKIREDARAVEKAGASSVVIEAVPEYLGREITETLSIPTIGIGASPTCDGQVLVTDDLIGLYGEFSPKFAKRYVDISRDIKKAAMSYAADVKSGSFPSMDHCFHVDKTADSED